MSTLVGARTLRTIVEDRARSAADALFVIFDDLNGRVSTRTYREFERDVNRTAHLLHDIGVRRCDKLSLLLGNCLEFLYLWFAAAKIGAVIVPVNTASSASELEYLVSHSESKLIFTHANHLETANQIGRRCPGVEAVITCGSGAPTPSADFTELVADRAETPPQGPAPAPADEAAILYTSGTTARPKGVLVTHANYIYAGETVSQAIRLLPEDRHLVVLPLFHGNAQYYSTMSALVTGASMALMARFNPAPHDFFGQPSASRRMSYVPGKTARGWGLGGSPEGDRRGLSLVGARRHGGGGRRGGKYPSSSSGSRGSRSRASVDATG